MPLRLLKLFRSSVPTGKDGLTQPQREAIADLLHLGIYADKTVSLSEDAIVDDTVDSFSWDPSVAWETFEAHSIARARHASENLAQLDSQLVSIAERLGTEAVRRKARDLCRRLFAADGSTCEAEKQLLARLEKAIGEVGTH
jgi:hypothetical protein